MDAFQERGGGLALIHAAVIADTHPEQLAQRIGLAAQPGRVMAMGQGRAPLTGRCLDPTNITKGYPGAFHELGIDRLEL